MLFNSNPINFLFSCFAANNVVPLPQNGSRTVCPSFVVNLIRIFINSIGFCVGCRPLSDFSDLTVIKLLHSRPISFNAFSLKAPTP